MTDFLLVGATCPKCGVESDGIYMRTDEMPDDLFCQSCRDDEAPAPVFQHGPSVVPAPFRREGTGRELHRAHDTPVAEAPFGTPSRRRLRKIP